MPPLPSRAVAGAQKPLGNAGDVAPSGCTLARGPCLTARLCHRAEKAQHIGLSTNEDAASCTVCAMRGDPLICSVQQSRPLLSLQHSCAEPSVRWSIQHSVPAIAAAFEPSAFVCRIQHSVPAIAAVVEPSAFVCRIQHSVPAIAAVVEASAFVAASSNCSRC